MPTATVAEADVQRIGRALHAALPSPARHPLRAVDDRAMDLASRDQELKAALFRFVDVVPACRSADDLARHLVGFLSEVDHPPAPLAAAQRLGDSAAGRKAIGVAAARGVKHMAHRFIVGADPDDALPALKALWRKDVATSVDLLGEMTVTQDEADRYARRCGEALEVLARKAKAKEQGANLSVKVTALTPLLRAEAPERGQEDAKPRLRALLRRARDLGAHLHVDSESLDSRDAVFDLALELLAEPEFAEGPSAGVVLQAYLRDAPEALDRILDWTARHPRRHPLSVRLVKGAYWDHELVDAVQHGWPVPVWEDKAESDRCFEDLTRRLLDARAGGDVAVAIASHNLRSVAHAIAAAGDDREGFEVQVLRGLGDPLQDALAAIGHPVRTYCPVGDLVSGMAYLVRRLLENTSNDSFLAAQAGGASVDDLLRAP